MSKIIGLCVQLGLSVILFCFIAFLVFIIWNDLIVDLGGPNMTFGQSMLFLFLCRLLSGFESFSE